LKVYLLWHEHNKDEKLLGVFPSPEAAANAREMYLNLPGFRDVPDGFIIDSYVVGEWHWTEGYVT